jgi:transcription initiation factor IIE alpha subunit
MGLEPFESAHDVLVLIEEFRKYTDDDIVIYTGYYESEVSRYIEYLKKFKNIIIKFGRYRPYQSPHIDEVLGVKLASDNQYAVKIS